MIEVTANAPRRPQTMHSSREKGHDVESTGEGVSFRRPRLTTSHPEQAKRSKNRNSKATSVPVGLKSKRSSEITKAGSLSLDRESYHRPETRFLEVHLSGRVGRTEPVSRETLE
jgi:hypothetical protein